MNLWPLSTNLEPIIYAIQAKLSADKTIALRDITLAISNHSNDNSNNQQNIKQLLQNRPLPQQQLKQQVYEQHLQEHQTATQFVNVTATKSDILQKSTPPLSLYINYYHNNTQIMAAITNISTTNPFWPTINDMPNKEILNRSTGHNTNIIDVSVNNLFNPSNNSNTTTNHTFTDQDADDDVNDMLHTIEYIGNVLCFYYVPIIVGTGSIGNILSVFVFFKTKLRKLSSSFYLAALAVSDTCFLFGLFAQWLNFVDIHIYNREYFCQFFTFLTNLASFCSVWFVVAFTVERFIAVMYPLRRQTMCTVRRAKMVLVGLTVLGCFHCAPFWIFSTPVYKPKLESTICDIKSEYKDYITLLNYWDTVVVFAVPFTTIAVLNTFTCCTVWKFATVRRTLTMQKMKTSHLSLHRASSSPSSTCSVNVNTRGEGSITASTTTSALTATTNTPAAATTALIASGQQQQEITPYRITSNSLKRQKSTSCASSTTHSNGQQTNIVTLHQQRQHKQHSHHHHRATLIRHHATTSESCVASDIQQHSRKSRRRKITNSSQLKVTKMLLIVSTVFVCLNLPSCIMRMITYLETQSSANSKTTIVLQYIFHLLFITNFGINFVLYCVSGQNFRKAVLSMFRRVSTTQRDGNTQITVSEYYRNSGGIGGSCGTNASTRKRMMMTSQNCWNEIHELQRLK